MPTNLVAKGSGWVIPHSNDNSRGSYYQKQKSQSKGLKASTKQDKITTIEISEIKKQLENARTKYKPIQIKYLLIAEAPPDSIERFFYYEDVYKLDYLFVGVIKVLYPDFIDSFLENRKKRRSRDIKKLLLEAV